MLASKRINDLSQYVTNSGEPNQARIHARAFTSTSTTDSSAEWNAACK
jgi:hypothetical protein